MISGGKDYLPTVINIILKKITPPPGMALIPGGEFSMGSINPVGMQDGGKEMMNDARPVHRVRIDAFFMDEAEVTNLQYTAFVKATGYITIIEHTPSKAEFPDVPAENLVAGSVVFTPPAHEVPLDNFYQWWTYVAGANWRHPYGQNSDLKGKEKYPVVQVAWEDAAAYAKWAGKRLPTEAEWEFAARGGESGKIYSWGNQLKVKDKWMANIFQGSFPNKDAGNDGFAGIAPVKQFAPNNYGLYDITGNVWEWCADWYQYDYYATLHNQVTSSNPQGPLNALDPAEPSSKKKVQRGGSFICTDQYCTRYMVGTRGKAEWSSGANHVGFRCVKDVSLK